MSSFKHSNFAIDQKVDKKVKENFDYLVKLEMKKMENYQEIEEDEKRRMAIGEIFIRKEKFKLKRKQKAADKKKRRKVEKQKEKKQVEESLLKQCLLRVHNTTQSEDEKKSKGTDECDLDDTLAELEQELFNFFSSL